MTGYYSRSLDGHRSAYLDFVVKRFGGCRIGAWEVFFSKGPVLFLMVEENFGLYLAAALWRSLTGRRTAGLLFRPLPAIEGKTPRLHSKRVLLRMLRKLPLIQTLSIVPVTFDSRIGTIVDDWIYDFQLWDLSDADYQRFEQLSHAVTQNEIASPDIPSILFDAQRYANGRPLLVALGVQNKAKGIEGLAASLRAGGTADWAVLVAGRFAPDAAAARETIVAHGGLVIDRFLSDDEMLAVYAMADAAWCLYDPSYDQSSGILGRAVQLGVPPVVRTGSLSEAYCRAENVLHISAEGGEDFAITLSSLTARQTRDVPTARAHLVQNFEAPLWRALGLAMDRKG